MTPLFGNFLFGFVLILINLYFFTSLDVDSNVKRVANIIGVEFTLTLRTGKGRLRLSGNGRVSCVLRRKRSKVKSRIKRFSPIAIESQPKVKSRIKRFSHRLHLELKGLEAVRGTAAKEDLTLVDLTHCDNKMVTKVINNFTFILLSSLTTVIFHGMHLKRLVRIHDM